MHKEALEFIKIVKDEFPYYFFGKSVLEVGSYVSVWATTGSTLTFQVFHFQILR